MARKKVVEVVTEEVVEPITVVEDKAPAHLRALVRAWLHIESVSFHYDDRAFSVVRNRGSLTSELKMLTTGDAPVWVAKVVEFNDGAGPAQWQQGILDAAAQMIQEYA